MTPQIRFSHDYSKLPEDWEEEGATAYLFGVSEVEISSLPSEFIEYDTEIRDDRVPPKHYPLPETGRFLILTLFVPFGSTKLFTTIRRSTPEKKRYYEDMIGMEFELVRTKEAKK